MTKHTHIYIINHRTRSKYGIFVSAGYSIIFYSMQYLYIIIKIYIYLFTNDFNFKCFGSSSTPTITIINNRK